MARTRNQLVVDGFVAGLLGYAAVAALFALLNLASMQGAFRTPLLLGEALLGGVTGGTGPGSALAPVLAFNGLHLLVSLALGLALSFLIERAEDDHGLGYGLVFTLLVVFGFVPIFLGALTVELLRAITWTDVLLGSLTGALATLGYLGWVHRGLVTELFREANV
jgi:hypothetical protein